MKLNGLGHCGIMVNYACNAACRHCLYACSPKREKGYMTKEIASKIGELLQKGGCRHVHIGGGEPFLNFDALVLVIETLAKYNVYIDYIETNAFWVINEKKAIEYIKKLQSVGVDTLCISIDPFHAEYVAPIYPIKLAELCKKLDMGCFLWKANFISVLSKTDMKITHKREEFERELSKNYIKEIADFYRIRYGGRAMNIEEEYCEKHSFKELLSSQKCSSIISTEHYHIDLHASFIPSGCTGIIMPFDEIVAGIEKGKYPLVDALVNGGVRELYDLACERGFSPQERYTSKCALCIDIRQYLSQNYDYAELNKEHYIASKSYY